MATPALKLRLSIRSAARTPVLTISRLSETPIYLFAQTRAASHAAQGHANRAARGPGKRLGAKKGASAPVVPGNIIFRQRGSKWFAGENCIMGRDHTISALAKGFVRYYRDPIRHPDRKLIGVVFDQEETLPRPLNAPRRRRLGFEAIPRNYASEATIAESVEEMETPTVAGAIKGSEVVVQHKHGYQYRMSNREIGMLGLRLTEKFKNEDRKYKKLVALRNRSKRGEAMEEDGKAKAKGKSKKK